MANFVHIAGCSLNLDLIRCAWNKEHVVVAESGHQPLIVRGADMDVLAEAVGLPTAAEIEAKRAECQKARADKVNPPKATYKTKTFAGSAGSETIGN